MANNLKWKEAAGVVAVIAVLAGLPVLLYAWRTGLRTRHYPPGSRIFTLTAVARDGLWTEEDVVGYNYWWKKPTRVEEIELNQGDHVVVRLKSVDVLHSFAIPLLHLGPVDVPAGHTVEVQFDAKRAGPLTFLCWQVCSPEHQGLHGRFLVKGTAKEESW